jgi:hypothetical protein
LKSGVRFAAATVGLVAVLGWVMGLAFRTPADHHAIWVSAGIAIVVQLFAFTIVRLTSRDNVMAAWGVGAILRLVVLGVYGLVIVRALGLAPMAALLSLAVFLFLSTLLEPLFLKA